jgi:ABC-type transporter Mla MlaB component
MATETVILDCARIHDPDIGTIGRIARRGLEARRRGCELRLRNPNTALLDLIALAGLETLLRVEVQRQPEEWKQLRRVQEERELADPTA